MGAYNYYRGTKLKRPPSDGETELFRWFLFQLVMVAIIAALCISINISGSSFGRNRVTYSQAVVQSTVKDSNEADRAYAVVAILRSASYELEDYVLYDTVLSNDKSYFKSNDGVPYDSFRTKFEKHYMSKFNRNCDMTVIAKYTDDMLVAFAYSYNSNNEINVYSVDSGKITKQDTSGLSMDTIIDTYFTVDSKI